MSMIGSDLNASIPKVDLPSSRTRWGLRILLRRALWQGFLMHVVRFMPRPLNSLRIMLLRAAGAKIGPRCLIMPGVKVFIPWNLEFADCVAIGHNVELYGHGKIRIKSNTLISQYSFLCTSSHDYTRPDMLAICADIEIGSECWVASGVFIGPGVMIGDGTVIGARSVVTKSMPGRIVCAGNPCRPIKPRTLSAIQP
jgi:putative colanic acid biosynthesis acetyltransferase WcaF